MSIHEFNELRLEVLIKKIETMERAIKNVLKDLRVDGTINASTINELRDFKDRYLDE